MAVSKRLRFEIFRRDNHTCRYCGRSAPEIKLVPDHIVPTALGGGDDPANLVTSCEDCNSGKSATPPDAPLVADVARDALRWAAAQQVVADRMVHDLEQRAALHRQFDDAWKAWGWVPRPDDWAQSVDAFVNAGLPIEVLVDAVNKAMVNKKVLTRDMFRYMCGIAWARVNKMREEVAAEVHGSPVDAPAATVAEQPLSASAHACLLLGYLDDASNSRAIDGAIRQAEQSGEPIPKGSKLIELALQWAFLDAIDRLAVVWLLLHDLFETVPESMLDDAIRKAQQDVGDGEQLDMVPRTAVHLIASLRSAQITWKHGES